MGSFLSIMSSAFDSFFGFIFWAVAFWHINEGRLFANAKMTTLTVINIIIFFLGLFILGPGLYASVQEIVYE